MAATPRSRNPTYLIAAGIVVSILGAIMAFLFVSQSGAGIAVPGTRAVLVAARPIAAHTALAADDLKQVQYPNELVPDGAFSSASQATGKFSVAGIAKGQPITADLVAASAQAAVSSGVDIPTGQVAVVIPPSDTRNLVAGLVQNGDKIDILANNLPGQSAGQVATTFTDLAVNIVPGTGGGPAQWIVYLSLPQAEELQYLLNNGQYHFVVKSRKDTGAQSTTPPVGRDEFNRAYGIH